MRKMTYFCDVCNEEKRVANKWWIVFMDSAGFKFHKWSKSKADAKGAKHVCGVNHLHKLIDEYTGKVKWASPQLVANIVQQSYHEEVSG